MENVSDNQNSSQTNDMSVNINTNPMMADQNGGGDADKSPRRGEMKDKTRKITDALGNFKWNQTDTVFASVRAEKDAVGTSFEQIGQGEPSKDPEVSDGSTPRTSSSLFLGPIRRSPDFAMELMASGPPRHMLNTPQGPVEPQTNLIVNYLPQTLTDDDFRLMFTNIGPIYSCRIMRDKRTGYSFGYGFVNYVKTQDAHKAITTLNGKQIQNKQIKVALARPSGEDIKHANLYVKGITKEMTREQLAELFKPYGEIIQSKILVDQYTGFSKGAGFILFSKRSEAEAAIQALHNTKPPGLNEFISVKRAKDESGEKSMVHHVIHHYQYPPGGGAPFGGPDVGGFPLGYLGFPSTVSGPGSMGANPLAPIPMSNMNMSRGGNFYANQFVNSPTNQRGPPPTVKLDSKAPYNFVPSSYPAQITAVNNNVGIADPNFRTNYSSISLGSHGSSNSDGNAKVNENGFTEVLFVYNIGTNADEKTLWSLFQPYGDITKVNVIRDHGKGGVSKGFGFVTMATPDQAQMAMEHLNGYVLNGRAIQVSPKK